MKALTLTLIGFLFAGCATTTPVDSKARALAVQKFGSDSYVKVAWFGPGIVDGLSMGLGNTSRELEIWDYVHDAKTKRVDLVVWSEPRSVAVPTILRTFRRMKGIQSGLEQLNFLFVGDADDAERVRPVIEPTGAKFFFHQR